MSQAPSFSALSEPNAVLPSLTSYEKKDGSLAFKLEQDCIYQLARAQRDSLEKLPELLIVDGLKMTGQGLVPWSPQRAVKTVWMAKADEHPGLQEMFEWQESVLSQMSQALQGEWKQYKFIEQVSDYFGNQWFKVTLKMMPNAEFRTLDNQTQIVYQTTPGTRLVGSVFRVVVWSMPAKQRENGTWSENMFGLTTQCLSASTASESEDMRAIIATDIEHRFRESQQFYPCFTIE